MSYTAKQVPLDWQHVELRAYTGDIVAEGNELWIRDAGETGWRLGGPSSLQLQPGHRATLFWCARDNVESNWIAGLNHTTQAFAIWNRDLNSLIVPAPRYYEGLFWIAGLAGVFAVASLATGGSTKSVVVLACSLAFFVGIHLRQKKLKAAIHEMLAEIERQQAKTSAISGEHSDREAIF